MGDSTKNIDKIRDSINLSMKKIVTSRGMTITLINPKSIKIERILGIIVRLTRRILVDL